MTKLELKTRSILREALREDRREGSRFIAEGWANYFLAEYDYDMGETAAEMAWDAYNETWRRKGINRRTLQ